MTREDYLQSQWKPYPTVPEKAAFWGRIVSIEPGVHRIRLKRQDSTEEVLAVEGEFPLEHLRLGDWVAALSSNQIVLLAPCRSGHYREQTQSGRLRDWNLFVQGVRSFFFKQDFIEVPTPSLVVCPGTEPSLDVFSTRYKRGRDERTLFLPTSPELHLKKALAQGFDAIFEVKSCFRNGEVTEVHQPEFTMLEWYRAGAKLTQIQEDALGLVDYLSRLSPGLRKPKRVQVFKVAELFLKHTGAFLTPESTREDYRKIAEAQGLRVRDDDSIDDLFFLIFTEKIETKFEKENLTFVIDWPPFQAALARLTPSGWGDRFEIYWQGLELANAFHELNDPAIQRARFGEDLAKKKAMGKEAVPLDEEFLESLESGMPPSAGIALGVERLFMALHGIDRITDLKVFTY